MFRYMEEVCSFSGVAGRMIKYMGKVPFFFFEIMLLATPWMGFSFILKMAAIIREILHGLAMCILDTIFYEPASCVFGESAY